MSHVLSIISCDARVLPAFVESRLHVRVDDAEDAAEELAARFDEMVRFVDAALDGGGTVYVHCGAGISRAPTAVAAWLVWKLQMRAVDALRLLRRERPCVRPNIGFVRELAKWEAKVRPRGCADA